MIGRYYYVWLDWCEGCLHSLDMIPWYYQKAKEQAREQVIIDTEGYDIGQWVNPECY